MTVLLALPRADARCVVEVPEARKGRRAHVPLIFEREVVVVTMIDDARREMWKCAPSERALARGEYASVV